MLLCFPVSLEMVGPVELLTVLWHVSDVSVDGHVLVLCSAGL